MQLMNCPTKRRSQRRRFSKWRTGQHFHILFLTCRFECIYLFILSDGLFGSCAKVSVGFLFKYSATKTQDFRKEHARNKSPSVYYIMQIDYREILVYVNSIGLHVRSAVVITVTHQNFHRLSQNELCTSLNISSLRNLLN